MKNIVNIFRRKEKLSLKELKKLKNTLRGVAEALCFAIVIFYMIAIFGKSLSLIIAMIMISKVIMVIAIVILIEIIACQKAIIEKLQDIIRR